MGGAVLVASCQAPFEFAPWVLPVADSVTVRGYDPVPESERRAAPPIELVEELVIGERGEDPRYLFGNTPPRVAVADDGRIAVLDPSNDRIQAYDAAGEFLATMGRRGQGPGELIQPLALLVDGETLLVYDVASRRTTRWSWTGELLESYAARWGGLIARTPEGDLVWRITEPHPERLDTVFQRAAPDGTVAVEYARTPWPQRVIDPPLGEIVGTEPDAWWVGTVPPASVANAAGEVYLSTFEEYQVFAYEPAGAMRWALQVSGGRPPISTQEIDYFMAIHARRFPERNAAQVAWPERQYALADIEVDGHGHLYVFPYVPKGTPAPAPRPVDVYSGAGERLYSGTIAGRLFGTAFAMYNGPMLEVGWQVARGDRLWGLAENAQTGDREVVRYRLVEPF